MRISTLLGLLFVFSILMMSCGDGDGEREINEGECSIADWIGTWILTSDAECEFAPMASIEFNEEIIIEEGTTETTLKWDGFENAFSDCVMRDELLILTLSDDVITSKLDICEATYMKQ